MSTQPPQAQQTFTLDQALQQAIAHREAGHYPQAVAWLDAVLQQHPQHAPALALLCHVQLLAKQPQQAAQTLEKARQLAPAHPDVLRNLARLALQQQQTDVALAAAQAVYQQQPTDTETRLVFAAALQAAGHLDQARALIEPALQARPDYAEAWAGRALLHLREKNHAAALADIEQALKLKPHMAAWWRMAASLYAGAGQLPAAIHALRQTLQREPGDLASLAALGETLRLSGARQEALSLLGEAARQLEAAAAQPPASVALWVNYGTALQEDGQSEAARAAYQKALAIDPRSAEVASNLGALAKEEEDWSAALRYFEQAFAAQPENPAIAANRAAALLALDRAEEAAAAARHLLARQPQHFDALCLLAGSQGKGKDYAAAQATLQAATPAANAPPEQQRRWHEAWADLHRAQKDWGAAERHLRQALAMRPDHLKTLHRLAGVLDRQLRHDEAWGALEQAFAARPDNADTLIAAAKHYASQERWAEAANTILQAIAGKSRSTTVYNLLSQALFHLEDYPRAAEAARRMIALDADFAVGHWMLGQALTSLGEEAAARSAIDQALALKPDDTAARMVLALWHKTQGQLPEAIATTRQCIGELWQALQAQTPAALLLDRSKKHMPVTEAGDTLLELHQVLCRLGVPYFLAYGTLLGIYRDGDLLPFDKDMDIGLPWHIDRNWLMDEIEAAGQWRVKGRALLKPEQAQWCFSVISQKNGIGTDFFFFKPELPGPGAALLSGFHHLPAPLLWRFSPIEIGSIRWRDTDLPAPADPERFMLDIYGEGWRVPDPCFDSVVTGRNLTAESRELAVCFGYTRLYEQLGRHNWKKAWGYCQQLLGYGDDALLRELGAWCEAEDKARRKAGMNP